jgi:site-specific recombinase XerD
VQVQIADMLDQQGDQRVALVGGPTLPRTGFANRSFHQVAAGSAAPVIARRKRSAQAWSKPSNFTSSTSWSAFMWTLEGPKLLAHMFYHEEGMRVKRCQQVGTVSFELVDDQGEIVAVVAGFVRYLSARGCSPNTLSAYAHDLLHFYRFLTRHSLTVGTFGPAESLALLEYLRQLPSRRPAQRLALVLATATAGESATRLAPTTINRIFATVSSFYEYLILFGHLTSENPMQLRPDPALARVSERHVPFMGHASRQRPVRRAVRVKTVLRLPRPLSDEQVSSLLASLTPLAGSSADAPDASGRLTTGRSPEPPPGGCAVWTAARHRSLSDRSSEGSAHKSRTERIVDLYEPGTLEALHRYVMDERPRDTDSSIIFLVGGSGSRRGEPLSYAGLVKLFQRHCERLGIRAPWLTPHALRHTHATRLWEGGMRELTLQKRLGHASPESTRLYTRVSDRVVVAEYQRTLGLDVSP